MQCCHHATNLLLCPARREGPISVALDCLSVCAYIPNTSRTQRPSFDATWIPVSRSKVKVPMPINAHTHCAPYLPNGKAYELRTWCTDGGRWGPTAATATMTSKVTRSHDQSELSGPNAVPAPLEPSRGIPCWLNPADTLRGWRVLNLQDSKLT